MIKTLKKYIVIAIYSFFICNCIIIQEENNITRRTRNPLNVQAEDLTDSRFYNKQALIEVLNLIASRLDSHKPLIILIDGDSRSGKTTLARDIENFFSSSMIKSTAIHMDHFLTMETISPEYISYAEQFGSTFNFDPLTGLYDHWDYSKAAEAVHSAISTGEEDIVILEGLNSGYIAMLGLVEFGLKIHVRANQQTREHIYMLTFPHNRDHMNSYLSNYSTRYDISDIDYDLIIQNNKADI
ncbi:MAG: hypothetical protein P9X27_00960 [Candidatus Kaelpia aquatica]|nr:hypothetical protein [Candidatus Kaelpia aquatica]